MDPRYSRNFSTLSRTDQQTLTDATVCVVGLGGLGGTVVEILARIGVGSLYLADGDVFEPSNLNRQLFSTENNLGGPKSAAAAARVHAVNPTTRVTAFQAFLSPENADDIVFNADLVVDCLDSIADRRMLQEIARRKNIPLVSGAIAGTAGQVTVIFPPDPGFSLIYGSGKTARDNGAGRSLGNLPQCAFLIASLQASEVIKVLLGRGELLRNKLLIVDLMGNAFEVMQLV